MGGAGPSVEFKPTVRLRRHHSEGAGGGKEEDNHLRAEEAYQRAIPFFTRWKEELVSEYGYEDHPLLSDDTLFAVSGPTKNASVSATARGCRIFKLPTATEGFARNSSPPWDRVFGSIDARRPNRISDDLYIDEAPPLQNILYLLQTMFDEMLTLVREDDIDDLGERICTRVLPRKEWIQQNSDIVKVVLGLPSTAELEQDAKTGIHITYRRYQAYEYNSYSDDKPDYFPDYTACDLECGYCGKCPYE